MSMPVLNEGIPCRRAVWGSLCRDMHPHSQIHPEVPLAFHTVAWDKRHPLLHHLLHPRLVLSSPGGLCYWLVGPVCNLTTFYYTETGHPSGSRLLVYLPPKGEQRYCAGAAGSERAGAGHGAGGAAGGPDAGPGGGARPPQGGALVSGGREAEPAGACGAARLLPGAAEGDRPALLRSGRASHPQQVRRPSARLLAPGCSPAKRPPSTPPGC